MDELKWIFILAILFRRWSVYLGGCVRCANQRRHRSDSLHLHNAEIPASTRPVVCGHGGRELQQQPSFQLDVHQVKDRSELHAAHAVASPPTDELGSTPPSYPPNLQRHHCCRCCRSSGPDGRDSRSISFNWNGQPPVAHGRPEKFLVTINSTQHLFIINVHVSPLINLLFHCDHQCRRNSVFSESLFQRFQVYYQQNHSLGEIHKENNNNNHKNKLLILQIYICMMIKYLYVLLWSLMHFFSVILSKENSNENDRYA